MVIKQFIHKTLKLLNNLRVQQPLALNMIKESSVGDFGLVLELVQTACGGNLYLNHVSVLTIPATVRTCCSTTTGAGA